MKEKNNFTVQQWLLNVVVCLFGVHEQHKPKINPPSRVEEPLPMQHQTAKNKVPYDLDKKGKPHKPKKDGRRRR